MLFLCVWTVCVRVCKLFLCFAIGVGLCMLLLCVLQVCVCAYVVCTRLNVVRMVLYVYLCVCVSVVYVVVRVAV